MVDGQKEYTLEHPLVQAAKKAFETRIYLIHKVQFDRAFRLLQTGMELSKVAKELGMDRQCFCATYYPHFQPFFGNGKERRTRETARRRERDRKLKEESILRECPPPETLQRVVERARDFGCELQYSFWGDSGVPRGVHHRKILHQGEIWAVSNTTNVFQPPNAQCRYIRGQAEICRLRKVRGVIFRAAAEDSERFYVIRREELLSRFVETEDGLLRLNFPLLPGQVVRNKKGLDITAFEDRWT